MPASSTEPRFRTTRYTIVCNPEHRSSSLAVSSIAACYRALITARERQIIHGNVEITYRAFNGATTSRRTAWQHTLTRHSLILHTRLATTP